METNKHAGGRSIKTRFIYDRTERVECGKCGFFELDETDPLGFCGHCKLINVGVVSFSSCIDVKKLKKHIEGYGTI